MSLADALTFIEAAGVVRATGEDRPLEAELGEAVDAANWSMIVRSRTPMSDLAA